MKVKTIQVWYVQFVGAMFGKPQVKVCTTYAEAAAEEKRISKFSPVSIIGPLDHMVKS